MTSTSEFFGEAATLTVHKPPGTHEAVLMIETMDSVASITLSSADVKLLAAALLLDETGRTDDKIGSEEPPESPRRA